MLIALYEQLMSYLASAPVHIQSRVIPRFCCQNFQQTQTSCRIDLSRHRLNQGVYACITTAQKAANKKKKKSDQILHTSYTLHLIHPCSSREDISPKDLDWILLNVLALSNGQCHQMIHRSHIRKPFLAFVAQESRLS